YACIYNKQCLTTLSYNEIPMDTNINSLSIFTAGTNYRYMLIYSKKSGYLQQYYPTSDGTTRVYMNECEVSSYVHNNLLANYDQSTLSSVFVNGKITKYNRDGERDY